MFARSTTPTTPASAQTPLLFPSRQNGEEAVAGGSGSSDASQYLIAQNEALHREVTSLRAQLTETKAEHQALEAEVDRLDTSTRYLRNLQQTLVSLYQESEGFVLFYRNTWRSAEAEASAFADETASLSRLCAYLAMGHLALFMGVLVYGTGLFGMLYDEGLIITSFTIYAVGLGASLVLSERWRIDAGRLERMCVLARGCGTDARRSHQRELRLKEKTHATAKSTLPGLEELIDSS